MCLDRLKVIPLTQGYYTIVNEEDFERFGHLKWFAKVGGTGGRPYAARSVRIGKKCTTVRLHRAIIDAKSGVEVDHKNRDTLDNRRGNLQSTTKIENLNNRCYNN